MSIARTVREETRRKVLRYVAAHGPVTARAVAFGLFGEGRTRTCARARVHEALTELEDIGQVSRARPPLYFPGIADTWTALH